MRLHLSLVHAAQRLSYARSMTEIVEVLTHAARQGTGADGVSVVLREGDLCYYVEEDAVGPLWKGRKFPMEMCVSGLSMRQKVPVCIRNIYTDPRVPHDAYRATFVKSLAVIPIRASDPIGAIGAYWADLHDATEEEVTALQTLADAASLAIENLQLISRLSEESKRKDQFLSMLAHELRSPLGPIRNSGYAIGMLAGDQGEIRRLADVIERQAAHMGHLVDGLLDASRLANGRLALERKRVDLNKLVRQVIADRRYLIDLARLELALTLPDAPTWVSADPTRLEQALVNILENAIKYTKAGSISVQLSTEAETACVAIADTGVGIDPAVIASVFEPFMQADASLAHSGGGLGLGLAVAQGVVALHGGQITAFSAGLGQGATFTVRLPLLEPAELAVISPEGTAVALPDGLPLAESTPKSSGQGSSARVLLIEDNVDAAQTLATFLRICGHEVTIAHDGPNGVLQARSWLPNVIICDIGLPGFDGYEVMRQLQLDTRTRSCPVIAVTGYAEQARHNIAAAGFTNHLVKPADPTELERLIRESIAQQTPMQEMVR